MFDSTKTPSLDSTSDYSAARDKAVAWLGERYLLAKPINAEVAHRTAASQTARPQWQTPLRHRARRPLARSNATE